MQKTLNDYGIVTAPLLLRDSHDLRYRAKTLRPEVEQHFNDLYAVFLHKLTALALQPTVTKKETARLRAFFDELLKAREA